MVKATIIGIQHTKQVKFMQITINVTFRSCARKERLVKFISLAKIRQGRSIKKQN